MNYENVLITGGAGFVGSNLAISFKRKYSRLKVIALDNLKRRGSELNITRLKREGIEFIHGDIRCPEDLRLGRRIDILLECSAEPSVLAGIKDNPLYIANTNLCATLNCLELARKDKADLIFLSTSRVYPYAAVNNIRTEEAKTRFEWLPNQRILGWSKEGLSEDFTLAGPKTLYGATKLCSEELIAEYIANYGIKAVINRCGVIAGPWQFGKVDQGVFTYWLLAHYFKRDLEYIGFGGKGKQVRDLVHIDDIFNLLDREIQLMPKLNGKTFNVGGSRKVSLSLLETSELCHTITGNRIKVRQSKENRQGDIRIYLSDIRKVCDETGWRPKKSAKEILIDTFRWINKHENEIKSSIIR